MAYVLCAADFRRSSHSTLVRSWQFMSAPHLLQCDAEEGVNKTWGFASIESDEVMEVMEVRVQYAGDRARNLLPPSPHHLITSSRASRRLTVKHSPDAPMDARSALYEALCVLRVV